MAGFSAGDHAWCVTGNPGQRKNLASKRLFVIRYSSTHPENRRFPFVAISLFAFTDHRPPLAPKGDAAASAAAVAPFVAILDVLTITRLTLPYFPLPCLLLSAVIKQVLNKPLGYLARVPAATAA